MQKQKNNDTPCIPRGLRIPGKLLQGATARALGLETSKRRLIQALEAFESNPASQEANFLLGRIRKIASQIEETEAKTIESAIERLDRITSDGAASTVSYLKACLIYYEAIKRRKLGAYNDPNRIKEFFIAVIERDLERINWFVEKAKKPGSKDNGPRMYDPIVLGKEQVQKNPRSLKAHFELGSSYRSSYMFDEAIETLNRAINLNPDDGEEHYLAGAHYQLAFACMEIGGYDEAIRNLKEVLRLEGEATAVSTLWSIGDACYRAGRFEDAIESYKKAAELRSTHAAVRHDLGKAYLELSRCGEAIESFQSALEINPKIGGAHFHMGKAYSEIGNEDKANEHFEQAIVCFKDRAEERTDDAMPHYWLGKVYFELGIYEDAINSLKQAIKLNSDITRAHYPNFARAHYALGKVYFEEDKYEEAVAEYSKAIAVEKRNSERYRPQRNADDYFARAQAYEALGEEELALKDRKIYYRFKNGSGICNNAIFSDNGWERSEALTSIEEQFPDDDYMRDLYFVDIARYCRFADTCHYAVNHISSDEKLKDVAKHGKNEQARLTAVARIRDQKILEDIAKNPGFFDAQQIAIDRLAEAVDNLDDIKTLKRVATKSKNEKAVKVAVEKLAAHIRMSDRFLYDEARAMIAIHSKDSDARKIAVDGMYSENLLLDVATNSEYPDTQQAAVDRLGSQVNILSTNTLLIVLARTEDGNVISEIAIRLAEKAFKSDSNELS